MLCPPKHTELGDVHVWNGRPDWDLLFSSVSRNHPHMDIGVMFCGNPMIGKDLRRQCHIHSKGRREGIFKLRKWMTYDVYVASCSICAIPPLLCCVLLLCCYSHVIFHLLYILYLCSDKENF